MQNKQTHYNGSFITNGDPTPAMKAAMESYMLQLKVEHERRERIRQGLESTAEWGTYNISDRH